MQRYRHDFNSKERILSFKAEVEGDRVQVGEAKPFKDIHVVFI
jgi:putative redox protein